MRLGLRGWVATMVGMALSWPALLVGADAPPGSAPPPASAAPASSIAPPAAPRGVSLRGCVELAERNHPNVWAARSRLKAMRAQLDEARSAPFSQFAVTGGFGLAPTVRGNDLY